MAKSKFTREQLVAQAMLMGAHYDWRDHTFNDVEGQKVWDADTLEVFELWSYALDNNGGMETRAAAVKAGTLGAADTHKFGALE